MGAGTRHPLVDEQGRIVRVVNVFVDIIADRKRRQTHSLLEAATRELARSLDWEATIQKVATLAVPDMADWCAVDLLEPDGSLEIIAIADLDPTKVEWAREILRRFRPRPADPSAVANVVRTRTSEMVPEVTQAMVDGADIDPEFRDVVDRLQLSSVMYVPLIAGDRTLGALTMVWADPGTTTPRRIVASPKISRPGLPSPSTMRGCIARGTK